MKKTIKQWLEELEEPYRAQALSNAKDYGCIDNTDISLAEALKGAFLWRDTKQGWDYWRVLYEDITRTEINS